MPFKCHIYATCAWLYMQISGKYISTYTSYELNAINNMTSSTVIHTFHITEICPWTNMPNCIAHICPTTLLLYSTYRLHITSHIHQKSITSNNYLPYYCKCQIYVICQNYVTCINVGSMPLYMTYINSLALTMWPGTLYLDETGRHWWHRIMMMTPKFDYIYWVGHLAKSAKNLFFKAITWHIYFLSFKTILRCNHKVDILYYTSHAKLHTDIHFKTINGKWRFNCKIKQICSLKRKYWQVWKTETVVSWVLLRCMFQILLKFQLLKLNN